ncbi:MAG: nucleotide sugar dehydrogenase [Coriobacteriales bacterium]|nr:nucleotide sugar dehydrogenase [Coriobacteriales bacterium]
MPAVHSRKAVAVVGFGYIGAVIGAVLADRGYDVVGIEPNERIRESVRAGDAPVPEPGLGELIAEAVSEGRLTITDDPAAVAECQTVLISVGTPLTATCNADTSQIAEAARAIAPHLRDGQLVMLKSTVPPRTTADLIAPIVTETAAVHVAFCPERLAEGRAIEEFRTIPVVVGGVDAESTVAAAAFWREALDVEVVEVSNSLGAELVKLADNLWIDLNIALANELAQLCDKLGGVDVLEVIHAANTLPKVEHNVNILVPSIGVGGYCLTKDPWFVHAMGADHGLDLQTPQVSRRVNDAMALYAAESIDETLREAGGGKRIAVLGVAFKTDTGDCRFTPTIPVIKSLLEKGYELKVHDPFVEGHEAECDLPLALEPDLAETLKDADCVAFFTGHRQFREISTEWLAGQVRPGALLFDGRMYFSREQIAEIESFGLAYKGVGR